MDLLCKVVSEGLQCFSAFIVLFQIKLAMAALILTKNLVIKTVFSLDSFLSFVYIVHVHVISLFLCVLAIGCDAMSCHWCVKWNVCMLVDTYTLLH